MSWGWDKMASRYMGAWMWQSLPQYDKRGMEHVYQGCRPKSFLVAYPKP